ncbi:uncharacterized protein LOC125075284 [Vanessa atalanta]|uniref:uncharacterized protein LOC125075284 n=1 Tax=Vanessa atalanta TaxID=42275 RepID=UPI001FCD1F8B|nr:uncharacterized protein LOC125075284 [Vanessa atalanta]
MNENETYYMETSPTEILIYIFTFLSPKERAKCCQVCWRWKRIVDNLSNNEGLWLKHCKKDFNDIYSVAYYKRVPGLSWFHIYRSLTLWSKLNKANESMDEFASATGCMEEIRDFQVLRHGLIGVHTRGAINYYDLDTLKLSRRTSITGNYLRYVENDDTIIILGYNLNLFVVRKLITDTHYETDVTFGNVKTFLLADEDLFYVTLTDEVFLCKLQDDQLKSVLLNQANSSIMSVGYHKGNINLLTFQRDIFTIVGNELIYRSTLDTSTNLLHELKKYNFLENLDWRVYFQWMYVLKHTVPEGPLRDIIIIKTYGEAVFVGSNWGVFRIYYAPYHNDEFDLFNSEPIKQFNFMERCDCPVLSMCPIIRIDVIEGEDSHIILIAMPKKIAVITYRHSFKETTAGAMLPYQDVHKIKILNISE